MHAVVNEDKTGRLFLRSI